MFSVVFHASDFFVDFFFCLGAIIIILFWIPQHLEESAERRKVSHLFSRRDRIYMRFFAFFACVIMSIDAFPGLFFRFKAVDWQQLFSLVFGSVLG